MSQKPNQIRIVCGSCKKHEPTFFCPKCNLKLCKLCKNKKHATESISKKHGVVLINEPKKEAKPLVKRTSWREKNPKKTEPKFQRAVFRQQKQMPDHKPTINKEKKEKTTNHQNKNPYSEKKTTKTNGQKKPFNTNKTTTTQNHRSTSTTKIQPEIKNKTKTEIQMENKKKEKLSKTEEKLRGINQKKLESQQNENKLKEIAKQKKQLLQFEKELAVKKVSLESSNLKIHYESQPQFDVDLFIDPKKPFKEGWLWKRGDTIKTWKKRYVRLYSDRLIYYENENSKEEKGTISLYNAKPGKTLVQKKRQILTIETSERVWHIGCDTTEKRTEWLSAITRIIFYCNKKRTPKIVFGDPILLLMPFEDSPLPSFLSTAIQYIQTKALKEEGLFRKSGSKSEMDVYIKATGQGLELDFSRETNPHNVTGLIKAWLRQLPEPLLTHRVLTILKREGDIKLDVIKELFLAIPKQNIKIITAFFSLFEKVIEFKEYNKMGIKNLSLVFAPSFCGKLTSLPKNGSLRITGLDISIVECQAIFLEIIFDVKDDLLQIIK
ncbi:rho gtpase-activating protein 68f [Anaeramoeba flamelloides]|uniref:Rho gtpase-activating protein 68f n=1 Tax=Anaeramoeba flamelloides TaxID=1746091 RepID=A0AAV8AFV2_9EUKA|nr:rho gtpase-activating protein 68f [Anaeramoeba flamelloides]